EGLDLFQIFNQKEFQLTKDFVSQLIHNRDQILDILADCELEDATETYKNNVWLMIDFLDPDSLKEVYDRIFQIPNSYTKEFSILVRHPKTAMYMENAPIELLKEFLSSTQLNNMPIWVATNLSELQLLHQMISCKAKSEKEYATNLNLI